MIIIMRIEDDYHYEYDGDQMITLFIMLVLLTMLKMSVLGSFPEKTLGDPPPLPPSKFDTTFF